ncbi:MAG: hypothetical protein HKN58_10975 [Xanthomonadales bacterium]|nr:hypothetical protein [Xanthomonadales bacterium]
MIVIAVVAILVALAVPAYRDYTIRAKISECINGAAVAKVQISEFRQTLGAWPPGTLEAGIDAPSGDSQFCTGFSGYQPANGSFVVDIDETAVDPILTSPIAPRFVPSSALSNVINWDCQAGGTSAAYTKYLPGSCRNTN